MTWGETAAEAALQIVVPSQVSRPSFKRHCSTVVPTVTDVGLKCVRARDVLSGGPLSYRGYALEASGHCGTVVPTVICDLHSVWKRARDDLSGGPLSYRGYALETSGHSGTVVPTVICIRIGSGPGWFSAGDR